MQSNTTGWIDATQRLPERSGEYIVNVGTIGVTTATYVRPDWEFIGDKLVRDRPTRPPGHWSYKGQQPPATVTHWMSLPVGPDGPLVARHPKRSASPNAVPYVQPADGGPPIPKAWEVERDKLRAALSTLRSRMDLRMGDTDPSDPDDPDLLAMRAASAALGQTT